jgi:hypothetical protein
MLQEFEHFLFCTSLAHTLYVTCAQQLSSIKLPLCNHFLCLFPLSAPQTKDSTCSCKGVTPLLSFSLCMFPTCEALERQHQALWPALKTSPCLRGGWVHVALEEARLRAHLDLWTLERGLNRTAVCFVSKALKVGWLLTSSWRDYVLHNDGRGWANSWRSANSTHPGIGFKGNARPRRTNHNAFTITERIK